MFAFGVTVRGAHLHALRLMQDRGGRQVWTRQRAVSDSPAVMVATQEPPMDEPDSRSVEGVAY